jgi:predicted Zn-dependent peptidase
MLAPAANEMALEIQKKVVIEEFKEVYLNQPYGDAWGELSKLAYTLHPYQWPVIGKDIGHLEKVTLGDVQAFFRQFYVPNNAVLVVAGAVEPNDVRQLAQKWFGPIPAGPTSNKKFIGEPTHQGPRRATLERPVPLDAIYKAYPTPAYGTPSHDAIQLGCVALGTGKSSRLYQQLVEGKKYFNTIEAHTTDTLDPGLLVIIGRINPDVPIALADEALSNLIDTLRQEGLTDDELAKAQHRLEADFFYDNIEIEQRAEALAIGTLLGDTNWINTNLAQLAAISLKAVDTAMAEALQPSCSATLYYQKKL